MEASDLNTRLPPRKRLLAGLRMASASCDHEQLPFPLASVNLAARLHDVMNSTASSPEEVVEAARSAASTAAEAAAAARAAALEKAAIAAKARAAARSALEFLDSISRHESPRNGHRIKAKLKKKHVQVKLLYKPNGHIANKENKEEGATPPGDKETDEELARKLHRAMNSSPRISNNKPKRPRTWGKDGTNGAAPRPLAGVGKLKNGCSFDKSGEKAVLCSNPDILEEEEEEEENEEEQDFLKYAGKRRIVSVGNFTGGRKAKLKRKKLLLNQCNIRDAEEPNEIPSYVDCVAYGNSKSNCGEKRASCTGIKPSNDALVPRRKLTSVWKYKKFKVSHCSSDSKILNAVCSTPSTAGTSAVVKAD